MEVDEIYNLACPASPVHYQYDPIKTIKTACIGAINMLGLAKRGKAKILQASTSEVYGDPKVHPQTESYWGNVNPIGPRACYDEGKRCAETLFFDYHRQHGVRIKVARIFNTYGPRMHPKDGRVVSNFIIQALPGEPITSTATAPRRKTSSSFASAKAANACWPRPRRVWTESQATIRGDRRLRDRLLQSRPLELRGLEAVRRAPGIRLPGSLLAFR